MAQQHGHATTTGVDAYGNPMPVHGPHATPGAAAGHGPAVVAGAPAAGTGRQGQFQPAAAAELRPRGILHRSNSSSSSSSSEDDGMGGRRKKGIKQKIKEKLPGGHKGNQPQPGTTAGGTFALAPPQAPVGATTGMYGQQGHHAGTGTYAPQGPAGVTNNTYGQQPVHHGNTTGTTGTYGHAGVTDTYGQHGHAGTAGTYGQPHAPVGAHGTATGEKKGIMDKIKEKIPGHH